MARSPKHGGATPLLFPDAAPVQPIRRAEPPEPEARLFVEVALDRPVRREFSYAVPDELAPGVGRGSRVAVPFGSRREIGVVVALSEVRPEIKGRLKAVAKVLDAEPLLDEDLLALTHWMADEYACSWGEALHAVLPAALKRETGRAKVLVARAAEGVGPEQLAELEEHQPKQHRLLRTLLEIDGTIELRELCKRLALSESPARTLARRGWISIEKVEIQDDPFDSSDAKRTRPDSLTEDQTVAVAAVLERLEAREHARYLLDGVTGSGKTEVYLAIIERALELGRGAIVLVPEIALTPQTVGWFRSRFEDVAVLHSRMTDAQRYRMWARVKRGEARVVVGARSAVFAPVRDLGVIVVDEEHEPSFKQGSVPRYHARNVALRRAASVGAVCILGSATPSLESWAATRAGDLFSLKLPTRVSGHGFPAIEVVDMRTQPVVKVGTHGTRLFSKRLLDLLGSGLERGEQSILFQNRRGFSTVLWCAGCKQTLRCEQCDVSLTFHRRIKRLVCHSCCEELVPPAACPTCTKPGLRFLGAGSERVEEELARFLPKVRVRRMDSDTMRRREDYEEALEAFGRGDLDVLVGTQMIAKGLDFPRVTLVGIVDADAALHLPDFRASERTFQLISQVAGRAGRGELAGRVIVQTTVPDHPAVKRAVAHDYAGFAEEENVLRSELDYPPFARLVRVLFEDEDEERAEAAAVRWSDVLRETLEGSAVQILGPAPAPISLARGRHRRHLLCKAPREGDDLDRLRTALAALAAETSRPKVMVDVDPTSLL